MLKEGPKTHMASNRHRNGLPPAGWCGPGLSQKTGRCASDGRELAGKNRAEGVGGKASRAPAPLAPGNGRGCQRKGAGVSPVGHPKPRDWAAARLTWGVRLIAMGR